MTSVTGDSLKQTTATLDELIAQDDKIGDGIKVLTKNRKSIRNAIKAIQKLSEPISKKTKKAKKARRKKSAPAAAAA